MIWEPTPSALCASIPASPTLAVDAKAKAMKAAGEDICGFGAGEPDFDTPDFIKQACIRALQDGKTKYCPAAGIPELRAAVAAKCVEFNKIVGVKESQIIISPGGKFSCYLGIFSVAGAGDEVLIPTPYWVSYPEMVKLAGAAPVFLPTTDKTDFKISPAQLEAAITPRTKLLILNSPSNPTGAVYTRAELEAIMEVVLKRRIMALSDEIYEHLLYDGQTHHSPASFSAEAAAATITVSGFSKSYSMTGWRVGTLTAHPKMVQAALRLQEQLTSNSTTFAQYGALEALQNKEAARAALLPMREAFDRRRQLLLAGLQATAGVTCQRAQGAFYLFPNISALGLSSQEFATRILEEEKVALVPGSGFGIEGYVRFSYATSEAVISKGIERFQRFCTKLS